MKRLNKNQKLIILTSIITVIVIIGIVIGANIIKTNIANGEYNSSNSDSNNGNLLPEYIKKGITLGGVTGTLEDLDTSDATATPEDIAWGKTAYADGKKITGTKIDSFIIEVSYTTSNITISVLTDLGEGVEYEYFINGESQGKTSDMIKTINIELQSKDPYIPTGFEHTEGEIDTGYVIKDTSIGNEFVWVPIKSGTFDVYVEAKKNDAYLNKSDVTTLEISELTREPKYSDIRYTDWKEEEGDVNDKKSIAYFKKSVFENGGFYMGRYEMGMPGQKSGEAPTLEIDKRNVTGVPVCIENVIPWINIDYEIAKTNLESMYSGEMQSAMMNSYARTSTLNWVYETNGKLNYDGVYQEFSWNSNLFFNGYYESWDSSFYNGIGSTVGYERATSITGEIFSLLISTGADIQGGNNFVNNNIYDLAGNAEEWTTEIYNSVGEHRKSGGDFQDNPNAHGIVDSNMGFPSYGLTADYTTSSRPILYK